MVKGNSRRWRSAHLKAVLSPRWGRGDIVRRKNKAGKATAARLQKSPEGKALLLLSLEAGWFFSFWQSGRIFIYCYIVLPIFQWAKAIKKWDDEVMSWEGTVTGWRVGSGLGWTRLT
jgi:hypothetical protein